jgi:hypothetical protein
MTLAFFIAFGMFLTGFVTGNLILITNGLAGMAAAGH